MDKQKALNKVEQLIKKLDDSWPNDDPKAYEEIIKQAKELAIQIRQEIRKA